MMRLGLSLSLNISYRAPTLSLHYARRAFDMPPYTPELPSFTHAGCACHTPRLMFYYINSHARGAKSHRTARFPFRIVRLLLPRQLRYCFCFFLLRRRKEVASSTLIIEIRLVAAYGIDIDATRVQPASLHKVPRFISLSFLLMLLDHFMNLRARYEMNRHYALNFCHTTVLYGFFIEATFISSGYSHSLYDVRLHIPARRFA